MVRYEGLFFGIPFFSDDTLEGAVVEFTKCDLDFAAILRAEALPLDEAAASLRRLLPKDAFEAVLRPEGVL